MGLSRVTRQSLQVLGSNIGTVTARDLGTIYPPFIRNDWSDPVAVTTTWDTDLSRATASLAEDALSLRTRPTLTVEARTLGVDPSESFEQLLGRMRTAHALAPMPLYSDRSVLTGNMGGGRVISCDVFCRRFYPGQRVALVPAEFDRVNIGGNFGHCEYGIIEQVTSRGIVLLDNVSGTWQTQDWVYPMLDCLPILESSGTLYTDHYLAGDVIFTEAGGQSAMPPTWRGFPEHLFNVHEERPVVNINEFTETPTVGFERPGKGYRMGKGSHVQADGDRPLLRFDFSLLHSTRLDAWNFLQLFDGCRGRGRYFWLVNPLTTFVVSGNSTTFVTIAQVDYRQVLEEGWVKHIAIELSDGRILIRNIVSVTEVGSSWRINWNTPLVLSGATPTRFTTAHAVRFASDDLTQNWITDEVVEAEVGFTEVRNPNLDPSIVNLANIRLNL